MTASIPQRIGPYTILGELGRGGMGVVYKAHRADMKRDYALKVMLPGQDASVDAIARFRREAQAAAKLADHEGIVGCRDIGEADGTVYFAMDLVEGKALDDLLDQDDLTPQDAARIVEEAARALHFAHALGILHRDIKPGNVLVAHDGRARVADFGLAGSQDADAQSARLTQSGVVLGTAAYMPPEQARGLTLDARADVYALGATLYECLTGSPPFGDGTVYELLAQLLRDDPKSPRRRDPRVPRDLDTITMKCLEKEPARRYATAEALAADLSRWRNGEPISARPVSGIERLTKHMRRHRVPWAVGAVGLAVAATVGAIFGGSAWSAGERERAATEEAAEARGAAAEARESEAKAHDAAREQLRKRAGLALDGALLLRSKGELAAMERFATETRDACAEALIALPNAPEPHYYLGRMQRATLEYDAALASQDQAIAADAGYAPARYERILLLARQWHDRVQLLRSREGRALAAKLVGGSASAARRALSSAPDMAALAAGDEQARALRARVTEDVAELLGAPGALEASRLECIRGLDAWLSGDREAAFEQLQAAAARTGELDGCELLAMAAGLEGAVGLASKWWYTAAARDAGVVRFAALAAEAAIAHLESGRLYEAGAESDLPIIEQRLDAALKQFPQDPELWRHRGHLATLSAGVEWRSGRDPLPLLKQAQERLTKALDLSAGGPHELDARRALALVLSRQGSRLGETGGDAVPLFEQAIAELERIAKTPPGDDVIAWHELAHARGNFASVLNNMGKASLPVYQQAMQEFDQARRLDPRAPQPLLGRAALMAESAGWLRALGRDPSPQLTEAIADVDAVIERLPDFGGAYDIRVRLRRILAQTRGMTDPAAARTMHEASLADVEKWAELNPESAGPLDARAGVLLELASLPGRPPAETEATLRKALENIDASLAILDSMRPRLQRVLICTSLGRTLVAQRRDATTFFDAALSDVNRLLAKTPGLAAALVARGTVRFDRARFRIPGADPRAEVDGAIGDLTEALKTVKADVVTLVVLGQAHLTRAQMERDPAAQRADLQQCLALTDRAIAINPALAPQLKPFADALRAQLGSGK